MLYYSLNKKAPKVNFEDATIKGQAPDKGLYFPEQLPALEKGFIENIGSFSKEEIGLKVITPYVGDTIPTDVLKQIVTETVDFNFPLVKINESIHALELYHGPTLAFKDVGARFMSRCLRHFVRNNDKEITVLVATSGDTGGAVANGFYNVEGVKVVILYPFGKVSSVQELQLTTLGNNVTAIEVDGIFDDCQALVKQAFADEALNQSVFLTSANSINVARWLPQQFYYFYAYQQWINKSNPPVICVPSGNFGNICAGILAHITGLPVAHFIAACNANDVVPDFINTGIYQTKNAIATLSNAMDVGDPSNFVRILEIFKQNYPDLKENLSSYSISDEVTRDTIAQVYQQENYLLDPHGAVAYAGLQQYSQQNENVKGIILETAHPIKFYDVVEPIINEKIPIPPAIQNILNKEKCSIRIKPQYQLLKDYLLSEKA